MSDDDLWFGDLDTPEPRTDGRTAWDDYVHFRRSFLDRRRVEELKALWRLPAAEAEGTGRPGGPDPA